MIRDPRSKALVFPANPAKKQQKADRKRLAHHSDEIQFLADCINYQQDIINKQAAIIEAVQQGKTPSTEGGNTSS